MNRLHLIFCLALVCLLFVSCDMPDYTDEINAAYFNAGGSAGNAECTYGKYRCSNGNSQFCAYSGNDLSWQLSEACSYGCDSSTGKCKSASDSGSGSNSGGNNSGDSGNNQNNDPTNPSTEEPTQSACYPNPCENLANSTGSCTTTPNGGYFCGCNSGYNWRRKECVIIPKVLGNICTGLTKCYEYDLINCNSSSIGDVYGQDAHYAARGTCIPQKFKIDSSVSNEKTVVDENTGLEWQQSTPTEKYSWENAVKYCEELNYGGHDDWRLPSPYELLTIVDNSKREPAVDTNFFPIFDYVWSSFSSSYAPNDDAWAMYYYEGSVETFAKTNTLYVMCVRGDKLPNASFTTSTIKGDIVVTDTTTGLIWQGVTSQYYDWSDALAYCENLTYAGYSDWRLPNKNELASLIDYNEYDPASNFPDITRGYIVSSTTVIGGYYASIWRFFFAFSGSFGSARKDSAGTFNEIKCVR